MTYELINAKTSNTIDAFDSKDEVRAAYERLVQSHQIEPDEVAVVVFDDEGEAQEVLPALQLA